jgi:hypothetical protein
MLTCGIHADAILEAARVDVETHVTAAKPLQPIDTEPAPAVPFRAAPLDSRTKRYRAETIDSGHGVAVGPQWRQRRPRNITDAEVSEEEYLLNEYVSSSHGLYPNKKTSYRASHWNSSLGLALCIQSCSVAVDLPIVELLGSTFCGGDCLKLFQNPQMLFPQMLSKATMIGSAVHDAAVALL